MTTTTVIVREVAGTVVVPTNFVPLPLASTHTATITTPSLASYAVYTGSLDVSNRFNVLNITSDQYSRFRLYSTHAALIADAARDTGSMATAGAGIFVDVVLHPYADSIDLSPIPLVYAGSPPGNTNAIWYAINNQDTTPHTITTTFLYLPE